MIDQLGKLCYWRIIISIDSWIHKLIIIDESLPGIASVPKTSNIFRNTPPHALAAQLQYRLAQNRAAINFSW
jgi:hypothetical protein